MRILFLPSWYPSKENRVKGVFIMEHAKAVSVYNEVVVVYSEGIDKETSQLWRVVSDKQEEGIRTIRIRYKRSPIPKTSYFIYLFSIFAVFKKLVKDGWKPDVIHAHVYSSGVPAVILGKLYKLPVVITEHFTVFPKRTLSRFEVIKARFALNNADIILPVSENLKEAIRAYKIHNKFEVVPNAVDPSIFFPPTTPPRNQKKRILFVALLRDGKGMEYLLPAISELAKTRQDFTLEVVGDGPNRMAYEEKTKRLGLEGVVIFHGMKTKREIADIMRTCDFFVCPSEHETFGVVLVEAMSCGLPIIASNVDAIPEIILSGTGVLIPPKNIKDLTNAIQDMLDRCEEYSRQDISKQAMGKYNYEVVGKRLDTVYRQLV